MFSLSKALQYAISNSLCCSKKYSWIFERNIFLCEFWNNLLDYLQLNNWDIHTFRLYMNNVVHFIWISDLKDFQIKIIEIIRTWMDIEIMWKGYEYLPYYRKGVIIAKLRLFPSEPIHKWCLWNSWLHWNENQKKTIKFNWE